MSTRDHSSEVISVEASAGSGKTYALASRYIDLILDPKYVFEENPFKSILAVTFTNKAAEEMKNRVMKFLKEIALAQKGDDPRKDKASVLVEQLLRNFSFFHVQTIDSLINKLLTGCSFRIKLSTGFEILDESNDLIRYSLDEVIDEAASDKTTAKLFKDFIKQYLFIEQETGWFPKENIFKMVRSLYADSNIYGKNYVIEGDTSKLYDLKKKLWKIVGDEYDIDKIPKKLITDEVHDLLKEIYECEAFRLFNSYAAIYERVIEKLQQIQIKEDVIFLEELNSKATCLFDEDMSVSEVYYRLATRFRHYLLDEFQDTSVLQWNNLFPLFHEAVAEGGSLFMVGDKKQAIYRFRGGDTSLFESSKEQLHEYSPSTRELKTNYRSDKNIVDFANKVFSEDNINQFLSEIVDKKNSVDISEYSDGIIGHFSQQQESLSDKKEGFVSAQWIEKDEEGAEDTTKTRALEIFDNIKDRFDLKDIAFLCDKNDEVEAVTSWLMEKGIPVDSEKTLSIRSNSGVKEIISLIKFLDSPIDNLSFASFVIGNIFLSASGLQLNEIQEFIIKCKDNRDDYYYKQFREKYPKQWEEFFEYLFKKTGFTPLYEFMVSVYERFSVLKKFPQDQAAFMKLLEVILEKEHKYPTPSAFLEYFDNARDGELFVSENGTDRVSVLTVHKAKGLEFGAVILPFFKMQVKVGGEKPYVIVPQKKGLQIVRLKKPMLGYSKKIDDIYLKEYVAALKDELNKAYVALTRPKHELYILIPKKSGQFNNLARLMIRDEKFENGSSVSHLSEVKPEEKILALAASDYEEITSKLREEYPDESTLRNREKVQRGDAAHLVLSYIKDLTGKDIDNELSQAAAKAGLSLIGADRDELLEKISQIIKNKLSKPIFYAKGADVETEKEVVDSSGLTKRIDRLIISDKEAIVVDYKSTKEGEEKHKGQVLSYVESISNLLPDKKVRGFLVYIDECEIEEIHG